MKTFSNLCALLLSLLLTQTAMAQQRYTLRGYVKDKQNGESLIGISIGVPGTGLGTVTNEYGFYSLTLPAGTHDIQFTYVGYTTFKTTIALKSNQSMDVKLEQSSSQLNEVTITGKQNDKAVNNMSTGLQKLSMAQMKKMPTFMGEVDVLRAIQTLPGVTTVGEGSSGFNVRGGATDENLILLDEAPVYNSSHMLGFFSVFNPDAVKSLNLMKGGFPAEYGGRTSSVLDIRMKDGNNQKMQVNGGIGDIFSRISVEGPIKKDESSFIIAARRSYVDILMKPFLKGDMKDTKLNFYDITGKLNFKLNKNNTLFVSGYIGRDVFGFQKQADLNWGNSTVSIRWNHVFNDRLFLNATTYYSNYDYNISFNNSTSKDANEQSEGYSWKSNIKNYGIKPAFTYYLNTNNTIHFGVNAIYYTFQPGTGIGSSGGTQLATILPDKHAVEAALYVDHEYKIGKKFGLQYGLRLSDFTYLGSGTAYYFRDTTPGIRKPFDHSKDFGKNEKIVTYKYLEPRINVRYNLTDDQALKASYTRTSQFMHQISNTASPTPVDIWTPSSNNIKPQLADQISLGYFYNARNDAFEASAEVFYKKIENQIDYIDNSNLYLNALVEGDLLPSHSRAYGLELYVKKDIGNNTGWISYTLSRSERQTNGISGGDWILNRYDRTHNLSFVGTHEFDKRHSLSVNFTYASGTPATYADARLEYQQWDIPYNTTDQRSNYRLPAYHRLDLSYTLKRPKHRRWEGEWVFSLYNVYARRNTYSIYFQQDPDNAAHREAVRLSIIGSIIPGITYNFKF
ncbi:TonB-dependent receptor [Chitinophaga costaii]|nr:TonB-dependent receptor [Chitinophaga costaii]PUZ24325.1 TonB-dependent receptor [Chitinophaga costaii]